MLATLTERRFSDPDWLFERKLDGERCLVYRDSGGSRLFSRNRKPLNATYPELVDAFDGQPESDLVVDGEIVAFEGRMTSFARLQQRMQLSDAERARHTGVSVYMYVFDLLRLDGVLLTGEELRRRKAELRRAVRFADPIRFLPHRVGRGEAYYRDACSRGWEGVIAKRASSPYVSGRSRDWLKFKCVSRQEFVVGGFTDPKGSRTEFGALLVGYYDGDRLRYAGKVGTGYNVTVLRDVGRRLRPLEQDASPFVDRDVPGRDVHWTRPELVAEIGFTEVTGDGRLRHPRFVGLRDDKSPREVVLERPRP